MLRARIAGSANARPLEGAWEIATTPPGRAQSPAELAAFDATWTPCGKPMPAAAALRGAARWNPDQSRDFDADDWWYRCRFASVPRQRGRLRFDGLATVAD